MMSGCDRFGGCYECVASDVTYNIGRVRVKRGAHDTAEHRYYLPKIDDAGSAALGDQAKPYGLIDPEDRCTTNALDGLDCDFFAQ